MDGQGDRPGGALMVFVTKAVDSSEDYLFDWNVALGAANLITNSTWTLPEFPTGLTIVQNSTTPYTATVRLSGGQSGQVYDVANIVSLARECGGPQG